MDSIAALLGNGALPAELTTSLQEAFDKKVVEARAEAEQAVRAEFAARYENDKNKLVEAMDRMLTDVVARHESEKQAEVSRFLEARGAYRKAIRENRSSYRSKLNENLDQSRSFVKEQLASEVSKLREQKRRVVAEAVRGASKLEALREGMLKEQKARLTKVDEFVVRQVRKELEEFAVDKRALVETRMKLVTEGRNKLRETQTRFVKEASKNVEQAITESLSREMKQLHEDLERNRQNMFGRKIFEAVAAEFMTSYLAEGTEIRKLQNVLESKDAELSATSSKLAEALKEGQVASRKARLAEDRAVRSRSMGELLANLRGEKRTIMEGMLETVKTDALRETFSKLLPMVLDESARRPGPQGMKTLTETRAASKPATMMTGDQRSNRLRESSQVESFENNDSAVAEIVRLSGIHK